MQHNTIGLWLFAISYRSTYVCNAIYWFTLSSVYFSFFSCLSFPYCNGVYVNVYEVFYDNRYALNYISSHNWRQYFSRKLHTIYRSPTKFGGKLFVFEENQLIVMGSAIEERERERLTKEEREYTFCLFQLK